MNVKIICIITCFICFALHSISQLNSKIESNSQLANCELKLDKIVERKLYVLSNATPDNVVVFLNNTAIPFRRNGDHIIIYIPVMADTVDKPIVRISSTINHVQCNDLIINLPFVNSKVSTKIITEKIQDEEKIINLNLKDTIKAPIVKVADTILVKEKKQNILPNWISIYVDAYYALYKDSVGTNQFQKFTSTSPRSNVIGLNIAQINFQYDAEKVRGIASFYYGDFAKTSGSPDFNYIMEAHAGFRVSKKLWIDAGFFRTHLGTEGLLPRENICSSISIATIYEPTFVSGLRFNFLPNDKWNINFYILNGFNGFVDNNEKKSLGSSVSFTLNDHWNLGFSNYLGDDAPKSEDSISHLRFHQNVFINYQINKWLFQLGADYCIQKNADLIYPTKTASMSSGMLTAKYAFSDMLATYGRLEFYNDPNGFMSLLFSDNKGKMTGYKLWGITAGIELKPLDKMFMRIEGRRIQMNEDQKIFYWNGLNTNIRSEIMLNTGITF